VSWLVEQKDPISPSAIRVNASDADLTSTIARMLRYKFLSVEPSYKDCETMGMPIQ